MLAEYAQFGLSEAQATLGMGWDAALECFDLTPYDEAGLARFRPTPRAISPEFARLFAEEADPFFRAFRARTTGPFALEEPGFRVLVVEAGSGTLRWDRGEADAAAGQTWVVPHAVGALGIDGEMDVLVCEPPRIE